MRRVLGVLVALTLVMLSFAGPAPPARAAGEPQFVDTRPIVLDLELDESDGPWRVDVLNPSAKATTLTALVSGLEDVVVKPSSLAVEAGKVGSFTVEVGDGATAAAGRLLVTDTAGNVVHRDIRLVFGSRTGPPPDVRLIGWNLVPFADEVYVPSKVSSALAPVGADTSVGVMQSPHGEFGRAVIDAAGRVSLRDLSGAGEYTGTVALGGERAAKVVVKVRDVFVWPLLVLLVGLLLVGIVERYTKRIGPRAQLRVNLLRLQDSVEAAERQAQAAVARLPGAVVPRVGAVFEAAARDAVAAVSRATSDTLREQWSETGARYTAMETLAKRSRTVARTTASLVDELVTLQSTIPGRRLHDVPALDDVLACLRVELLGDEDGLAAHEQRLVTQQATVRDLARVLDTLDDLLRGDLQPDHHARATGLRRTLVADGVPLPVVGEQVHKLAQDVAASARAVERRLHDAAVTAPMEAPTAAASPPASHVPPPGLPPPTAARRGGMLRWVGAAAVVVVGLAVVSTLLGEGVEEANHGGGGMYPLPSATSVIPTTTLPEAPTEVRPSAGVDAVDGDDDPAWGLLVFWLGVAVAAVLLGGRLAHGLLRRWSSDRVGDDDSTAALEQAVAKEEQAFAWLSGALVVATGMSVLYFPNETFGSLGDYVEVLLWGSAVGEGVKLARRLSPRLTGA